jgi:hypothetical protein
MKRAFPLLFVAASLVIHHARLAEEASPDWNSADCRHICYSKVKTAQELSRNGPSPLRQTNCRPL